MKKYLILNRNKQHTLKLIIIFCWIIVPLLGTSQTIPKVDLDAVIKSDAPEKEFPETIRQLNEKHADNDINTTPKCHFFAYRELYDFYRNQHDFDEALIIANRMYEISQKHDLKEEQAEACLLLGMTYRHFNVSVDSVLNIFTEGLNISLELKPIRDITGHLYLHLGYLYNEDLMQLDKAFEFYHQSSIIAETTNNTGLRLIALNTLSGLLKRQKQFKKARYFSAQIIDLLKDHKFKDPFNNSMMAEAYGNMGELDSALVYYKKNLKHSSRQDFYVSLNRIGSVYVYKEKYKIAKQYFLRAYRDTTASAIYNQHMTLGNLARVTLRQQDYTQSIHYANLGLEHLVSTNRMTSSRSVEFYDILKEAYEQTGNYQAALEASKRFYNQRDTIYRLESNTKIERLLTQHKVEEKELENAALRATQQQRTVLGVSATIFAILMTIIAILQKRARDLKSQQNELLEQKVKARTAELTKTSEQLAEIKHLQLFEEAKSRFFANVSHEFRTPLTLIQGPLSTLHDNGRLNKKDNNMVKRALQNTKQLLRLVNQVLDLTKFDSSQLHLHESSEVFYLLMRRLVGSFETYAQSKNITLSLEYFPKTELQLKIDTDKFEKVLNNYLSNAIKFTPKGGEITVKVEDLENRLQISVADTGIGIPEDKLEMVFERFYQVQEKEDNAPLGQVSHYAGGTGIGLALCKEYADLMNGKAWANSQKGQGSTFYFEFPKKEILKPINEEIQNAIKVQLNTSEAQNYLQPLNNNDSTETEHSNIILLVEDNYDLRDFISTLLMDKYKVIAVENGQAALDQLNTMNELPSLIISDVMMPVMNGFQLIEKLKNSEAFRHIPVMMLTARADMKDKLKALRIGVDDYMLKPFVNNELLVRVDNLILNFNSRKEMFFVHTEEETPKIKITHTKEDTEWLQDLEKVVTNHITDFKLNADRVAAHMNVSRSKLFRKTKKTTGLTVNDYIKELRLQKARNMIETGEAQSTKEVAYSVGYKHVDYFAQSYEKRFGKRPSSYFN